MEILILIGQILVGILLLTFLVVIHELGHAIIARRNGVVVEEFGIGFPPRAWAKKIKKYGVKLSINWLPLGGFVKMQGENDAATKKGDYGAASTWSKTKILLAGVTANWIFAMIAFTLLAVIGFPKVLPGQFTIANDTRTVAEPLKISYVEEKSPADKAGIKRGDHIKKIGDMKVNQPDDLMQASKKYKGKEVAVNYERAGKPESVKVKLRENPTPQQGILGVNSAAKTTYYSTWSAPIVGVGATIQFSVVTLQELGKMLGNLVTGLLYQLSGNEKMREQGSAAVSEAGANVAGPIGILGVIFPAAQKAGPATLLFLTGVISLTLAVMNILPIPALDGGRLFLMLLYKSLRRPLTKEREEQIVGLSFLFLLGLIVVITFADVYKFL